MQRAQLDAPVYLFSENGRNYWQFANQVYWENDGLDGESIRALLIAKQKRQEAQVDRAKQMAARGSGPQVGPMRSGIPDDVKKMVWVRDRGECQGCGSTVNLQFDHVIPVAMGGNSSAENLQILCAECNRRKGAGLTLD